MTIILVVLSLALLMMLVERLKPGRTFPTVRGWWARAIAVSVLQVGIVFLAGVTWDGWLVRNAPWSAGRLGTAGGAVAGYVAVTFIYYWWHRARHQSPFLWRWFHQFHHSPQRIEIITSFYKHPFELLANGVLSSLIVYWLVGLDAKTATIAVTITGVAELFYHWNVRTPHWLGFVIQSADSALVAPVFRG